MQRPSARRRVRVALARKVLLALNTLAPLVLDFRAIPAR